MIWRERWSEQTRMTIVYGGMSSMLQLPTAELNLSPRHARRNDTNMNEQIGGVGFA